MKKSTILILVVLSFLACQEENKKTSSVEKNKDIVLFSQITSQNSNITFANNLKESYEFNFLVYPYIYIGGGVAVGDINNDGLQDIYFTSNQESNKLYLNKGDFQFEDITTSSGADDSTGWTTGTSMIDINNDGYMDIYVCKSASVNNNDLRRNKLFINQKNNTFKESAKSYGLDHPGYSTQSYFFDYDMDGDLDMYLVNHRPDFKNNGKISLTIQNDIQEESSDQLFRNDGAKFTKVSASAGIMNKAWGLSASVGDFNNDNWPDIYVANDYLEPDILYINNKNGTFKNEVLDRMKHISFNSMGSDFADINNDLMPDLVVLDMLAEDHSRGKENMATMSTQNFNSMVARGYHHQYMSNVLQLNNGNGNFSEIGQLSGITKTDWSWAPLVADFDNDGYKDIFITNGIEKDLGNQDFRRSLKQLNQQNKAMALEDVLNMIPAEKLPNYVFKNNGDLTFSNYQQKWGLGHKVNSNGAAYADFDNDGDLDLVINNENDIASLYKNNSVNNYISIALSGQANNALAIGSKVKVTTENGQQIQELYLNRGFQSSVSNILNFGLGDQEQIASIEVTWPDGKSSRLTNVDVNQLVELSHQNAEASAVSQANKNHLFEHINNAVLGSAFKHQENNFNDYSKQLLLPQKQSTPGPCLSVADVNGDALDDFYVGGALGQSGQLYVQNTDGSFRTMEITVFETDKNHEDTASLFFDVDNDNDLDLYVSSGGYELTENHALLQDRLYINDGNGNYSKSTNLPTILASTKVVKPLDYDNDGDQDLIVGGYVIPGQYPLAPGSFLLENNKGTFTDVTSTKAPDLKTLGMVSDIEVVASESTNSLELMIVGHWMPITLFTYENNIFNKKSISEFEKTEGWYNTISSADFDNDGDIDFVVGNIGHNNKFKPTTSKPLHIFSSDFDNNGSYDIALSKYYKGQLVPVRGKECSSEQTPFLNEKIGTYKEFGSLNIEGVYGNEVIENSNHMMAYSFKSIYIENKGNTTFELNDLPNESQLSATQDFEIVDINNDGILDIIGVGNLYDAEVETIRYDASRGYILINDGKGNFKTLKDHGFVCDKDMRAVSKIKINGENHIIVANNNDNLSVFKAIK